MQPCLHSSYEKENGEQTTHTGLLVKPIQTHLMNKKHKALTISIGLVYILFGFLKFFPNYSPAEAVGIDTVAVLTFGLFDQQLAIIALALLEVGIGLLLVSGRFLRIGVGLALAHMVCTFAPFFIFPELTFGAEMPSPSLLGQYILKNIVFICALVAIYPTAAVSTDTPVQRSTTDVAV